MWIEVHGSFARHPKVYRAARLLRVSPNEVKGVLVNLWLYMQEHSPEDSDLKSFGNDLLSDVFQVKKSQVSKWIRALIECGSEGKPGFLEEKDGQIIIRNWERYSEKYRLYNLRKHSDLERQRRYRERKVSHETLRDESRDINVVGDVTGDAVVTPPQDKTRQDKTLPPFIPPKEKTVTKPEQDPLERVIEIFEEVSGQPAMDDAYHNGYNGVAIFLSGNGHTPEQVYASARNYLAAEYPINKSVGGWGKDITKWLTGPNTVTPPEDEDADPYSVDSIEGKNFTLKGRGNE